MQAGNQNASPPYVLSQIEKASASATEFSTAFNNFIADGPNSPHAEIIRTVSIFSGSIADTLSNTKGLSRFANDEKSSDQLFGAARKSAQATVRFFRGLQSFRIEGMEPLQKTDVVINNNLEVQRDLQTLSKLVESFAPKSSKISTKGDLGDLVDSELTKAADAIDAAAQRLAKLKNKPRDGYSTYELRINDSILAAAIAVTNAIAELIRAATVSQEEIVREGRGSSSKTAFYKKNNRWTEGLISAAKAVASSTNTLIETADGVISGRNSPEQLIVASNDVAASTAQLVAASRVKATFMSKTQDRLETASKAVGAACRALVRQVQEIIAEKHQGDNEAEDYTKLSSHEFKVREMEQQVRVELLPTTIFVPSPHPSSLQLLTFLPRRSRSSSSKTTFRGPARALAKCARSRTRRTELSTALSLFLSPASSSLFRRIPLCISKEPPRGLRDFHAYPCSLASRSALVLRRPATREAQDMSVSKEREPLELVSVRGKLQLAGCQDRGNHATSAADPWTGSLGIADDKEPRLPSPAPRTKNSGLRELPGNSTPWNG